MISSRRRREGVELRRKNVEDILSNSESISILQSERELTGWKMCAFLRDLEEEEFLAAGTATCKRGSAQYLQQVEAFYMRNIYTKELFPRTYREKIVLQAVTMQDLSLFKEKFCNKRKAPDDVGLTLCVVVWCLMFLMMIMMFSR